MSADDRALSRELTSIVRATPGVHDVYSTGGLVAAVLSGAVLAGADDDARVAVDGDAVTASIAVAAGHSAPETLRAVSAVIAAHLAAVGRDTDRISVRASRVE